MATQFCTDYIYSKKQIDDLVYQFRMLHAFRKPDYLVLHTETLRAVCGGFGIGMVPPNLSGIPYTLCDDLPFGRVMVCEI